MTSLTMALLLVAAAEPAPLKPGHVVYTTGFEQAAERTAWSQAPFASWQPGNGGMVLQVTVPADQTGTSHMIRLPLDLTAYRGCKVVFECRAKADGVTKPKNEWNGVKFMLHYKSQASGPQWTNENGVHGTFDWKSIGFTAKIAPDATGGELNLGLQDCTGTVLFDDLKATVLTPAAPSRPAPPANPGPVYRGHDLPRLRGVMSPNQFRDEDMRVLGMEWNANLIRWQITRNWGKAGTERDLAEYDQWIEAELADLDKALEACGRYGIKVLVDLHSPPGGRHENRDLAIFHEAAYQDHWVKVWERIARRYQGNKVIWGYDLVNEPTQTRPSREHMADYLESQVRVARAIRAIDPVMPIVIEANEWDSPYGFADLQPVDVPNVIYQVHMYAPGQFTHQGVHGNPTGVVYPGVISGHEYNKEQLRKILAPVREFQLAYNVHIYCGEFSAARWAPGAAAYLRDCIDLFEEYGWDWTYHAYREWDGWSVEHGSDPADKQPTTAPTDRNQVLLEWFAKNQKPAG